MANKIIRGPVVSFRINDFRDTTGACIFVEVFDTPANKNTSRINPKNMWTTFSFAPEEWDEVLNTCETFKNSPLNRGKIGNIFSHLKKASF